jgi:hypothetical protein
MSDGLFADMGIKAFFEVLQRDPMVSGEEILHIMNGLFYLSRGGVNLYPIASGDDHILLDRREGMNLAEGLLHFILWKGQAFANLNRGCVMI